MSAPDRRWSDADRELAVRAYKATPPPRGWRDDELIAARVGAVLDALTAAGWRARSRYAGEGEARCGEPHPDGGPPCQLRPGHDTHTRPASGGSDLWKRETDAR